MQSNRPEATPIPSKSAYPRTVYVRATEEEKARISARAKASGISESRLLARLATEGAAPPTLEEREDLRAVRLLLSRLASSLGEIAMRLDLAKTNPSAEPPTVEEIAATVRVADALSRGLAKRLRI